MFKIRNGSNLWLNIFCFSNKVRVDFDSSAIDETYEDYNESLSINIKFIEETKIKR